METRRDGDGEGGRVSLAVPDPPAGAARTDEEPRRGDPDAETKGVDSDATKSAPNRQPQRSARGSIGQPLEPLRLRASLYSSGERVTEFCGLVRELQAELDMPVWMIVQGENDRGPWSALGSRIADVLRSEVFRDQSPRLAVLVHSLGGSATCAYQLGTAFAKRSQGFVCVVPRHAKSAATLMALGANEILLGRLGELGPLDAQIDESMSALDEVLSLEQLQTFALETLDVTTQFLVARTRKNVDAILPMATQFVHGLVRPLFNGVDAVRYTQLCRTLKVAEEYAVRLMVLRKLSREKAIKIANRLIRTYPEHAFAIDFNEIEDIGLEVREATGRVSDILDRMVPMLSKVSAIGTVVQDKGETR